MGFLDRKIDTIFIMLGNGCNMSCKYCLQRPLVHHQISARINPDIYGFIRQVARENGDDRLWLRFFGGEPLLYFNSIKRIVEELGDVTSYSIITNGRAMTDEMVEFFNAHDMPVTISWDGKNVLETRGFDVFDERKPLRRRLLRLNRLGLSAVMSAKAYPKEVLESFDEINDEYLKLHDYPIMVNIDPIFDTGLPDKSLMNMDCERICEEMADLTNTYIEHLKNNKRVGVADIYLDAFFRYIKGWCDRNGEYNRVLCGCGNGYNILNLDLEGKLYECHNVSDSVGDIYMPYFKYLEEIIKRDNIKERQKTCKDCMASYFCNSGCKLIPEDKLYEAFCKSRKAAYGTVLLTLQEYGRGLTDGDNRRDNDRKRHNS